MISKLFKLVALCGTAFTYFSIASMLTLSIGVGMFVWKGGASGDKWVQILAVLNGLDLQDFWTKIEAASMPRREEQLSYEEVLEARVKAGLDWDMREGAIQRAVNDLRLMETAFRGGRESFDQERKRFVADLERQQKQVESQQLAELQETLAALSPKQAKEQIKMWLDDPQEKYPIPGRDVMVDVVTMLKSFSQDRLGKIAKEFKTPEESKMLHDILERIRIGPKEELIQQMRDKLDDAAARPAAGPTR